MVVDGEYRSGYYAASFIGMVPYRASALSRVRQSRAADRVVLRKRRCRAGLCGDFARGNAARRSPADGAPAWLKETIELPRLIARLPADTQVASVAGARGRQRHRERFAKGAARCGVRGDARNARRRPCIRGASGCQRCSRGRPRNGAGCESAPGVGVVIVSGFAPCAFDARRRILRRPVARPRRRRRYRHERQNHDVHMLQRSSTPPGGRAARSARSARRLAHVPGRSTTQRRFLRNHGLLASMRDAGASAVAMEVSSHALALGRVDDVRFRVGVLTNMTRDHLDFHQTMHAYAAAKRRLFSIARSAVLNAGDECGRAGRGNWPTRNTGRHLRRARRRERGAGRRRHHRKREPVYPRRNNVRPSAARPLQRFECARDHRRRARRSASTTLPSHAGSRNSIACRAAWSACTKTASTCSSTTLIRPTRWSTRFRRCAKPLPDGSRSFLGAAEIAIAASAAKWARRRRSSPTDCT